MSRFFLFVLFLFSVACSTPSPHPQRSLATDEAQVIIYLPSSAKKDIYRLYVNFQQQNIEIKNPLKLQVKEGRVHIELIRARQSAVIELRVDAHQHRFLRCIEDERGKIVLLEVEAS